MASAVGTWLADDWHRFWHWAETNGDQGWDGSGPQYTAEDEAYDRQLWAYSNSDVSVKADAVALASENFVQKVEEKAAKAADTLTDVDKLASLLNDFKWVLIAGAVILVVIEVAPLLGLVKK